MAFYNPLNSFLLQKTYFFKNWRARKLLRTFLFATVVAGSGVSAWPETPRNLSVPAAASQEQPGNQELKVRPEDAIKTFEGPANAPYTIGEGDELTIEVLNHPELSGKHVVGPDGEITLPGRGSLNIIGKSREEAAHAVSDDLSKDYLNITCTVRIDKYGSNRILLIGRVANPGVILFDHTPTLLEVISRSGGARQDDQAGKKTKDSVPARCAIFRGSDQVLWVDLRKLLSEGSTAVDMRLRRNDVVYVPADREDIVTVLGAVHSPGVIEFDHNTSLAEILAQAGGLTDDAAKTLRFVRPGTNLVRDIAISDVINHQPFEIAFERGDIVYVPKSGFAKVSHVLQQLSPAGTMLLFAGTLK